MDGFRFDLVGLLDTDTINEIVEEVHKTHPALRLSTSEDVKKYVKSVEGLGDNIVGINIKGGHDDCYCSDCSSGSCCGRSCYCCNEKEKSK